jgi:hypothetical protein
VLEPTEWVTMKLNDRLGDWAPRLGAPRLPTRAQTAISVLMMLPTLAPARD